MTTRGKALMAFWEGGGLILLGCAQLFEMSALVFAGVTSMALGAVAARFEMRGDLSVPPPNASKPKPAKPPRSRGSAGRGRKPGTAVKCTRTGQPIDQCSCASRHVATEAGVRRYKQATRVGDPIAGGGKVSTSKPASNGQRLPVGEVMRREY
jgi:hypothetical protein